MPRIARVVVPGEAHHITKRGNRRQRTGRPLGSEEFVTDLEARLGRQLRPKRPGPRPSGDRGS